MFNLKAKLWVDGRKYYPDFSNLKGYKVWFHCSSLGEFEQARPLIEKIKEEHPDYQIILSFFSPSGYEVRKNYHLATAVVYLPLDTHKNAERFINRLQPDLVLFVKYEFWFHFLNELKQRKIPTILFSSVFRAEQVFFKWHGVLFRYMLHTFDKIFVQNESSQALLQVIGISSLLASDSRFDRVAAIAGQKTEFPLIDLFKGKSKLFIAGSTWRKDEELVIQCIRKDLLKEYKYIIAPHELDKVHLTALRNSIPVNARFYSELSVENSADTDVVIVDNFGMLASLYAYAEIAYVGGGFNAGVHNILEAAVYGLPVIFGPNYKKALEATELIHLQGAFSINNFSSLQKTLSLLNHLPVYQAAANASARYVNTRTGGTNVVYSFLKSSRFLPA